MGGKPRPPRASPRDQPLTVAVEGGRLAISIGVATLAVAVENAPDPPLSRFDEESGDVVHYKVTDPYVFAREVLVELLAEREDGSTSITRMLDAVAWDAIDGGCEGIYHDGDEPVPKARMRR